MNTRTISGHVSILVVLSSLVVAAVCSADETDFTTSQQAIYHGSRSAQVVSLSAGEALAIGYLTDDSGDEYCTGTLIDRDVVITASHCTEGSSAGDVRFGIGHPERPDAVIPVQKIVEHTQLDAALLFLSKDAVREVPALEPLPFLREQLPQSMIGQQVEAAGFGETDDSSRGLYFAALTLVSIGESEYTVDGKGQQGICFGDSGGPLLVSLGGDTIVAGVESWGDESCVDQDHLTRLDLAASWIDSQQASFDPNAAPSGGSSSGPGVDFPNVEGNDDSVRLDSGEAGDDSGCSVDGERNGIDLGVLASVGFVLVIAFAGRRRRVTA